MRVMTTAQFAEESGVPSHTLSKLSVVKIIRDFMYSEKGPRLKRKEQLLKKEKSHGNGLI